MVGAAPAPHILPDLAVNILIPSSAIIAIVFGLWLWKRVSYISMTPGGWWEGRGGAEEAPGHASHPPRPCGMICVGQARAQAAPASVRRRIGAIGAPPRPGARLAGWRGEESHLPTCGCSAAFLLPPAQARTCSAAATAASICWRRSSGATMRCVRAAASIGRRRRRFSRLFRFACLSAVLSRARAACGVLASPTHRWCRRPPTSRRPSLREPTASCSPSTSTWACSWWVVLAWTFRVPGWCPPTNQPTNLAANQSTPHHPHHL